MEQHLESGLQDFVFRDSKSAGTFQKIKTAIPRRPDLVAIDTNTVSDVFGDNKFPWICSREASERLSRSKARSAAGLIDYQEQPSMVDSEDATARANLMPTDAKPNPHDHTTAIGQLRLRRRIERSVRKLLSAAPQPLKLQSEAWGGVHGGGHSRR